MKKMILLTMVLFALIVVSMTKLANDAQTKQAADVKITKTNA